MTLVRPCESCPFRSDRPGFLRQARAEEIAEVLLNDATFTCHKTVDYSEEPECDEDGEEIDDSQRGITEKSQHCAGALILLEKLENPNQWMRWMERIGFYDRRKLDMTVPVFDTFEEFIEHHDY